MEKKNTQSVGDLAEGNNEHVTPGTAARLRTRQRVPGNSFPPSKSAIGDFFRVYMGVAIRIDYAAVVGGDVREGTDGFDRLVVAGDVQDAVGPRDRRSYLVTYNRGTDVVSRVSEIGENVYVRAGTQLI
jgi:acetyltransferase-like isoleucine patch superfamily enzyme